MVGKLDINVVFMSVKIVGQRGAGSALICRTGQFLGPAGCFWQ